MNRTAEDILMHYGVERRSGRYPWGSGKNPFQHSGDFLSRVLELRKSGMKETDIAKDLGLSTTELRVQEALAKHERRSVIVAAIKDLKEKGYSLNQIAEKMGYKNDSSVRSRLDENAEARMNQSMKTAEFLKKMVDERGMIDVGKGVEFELNVSSTKVKEALYILEREGYEVFGAGIPDPTNPRQQTTMTVLCPPGTEHKEVYRFEDIHTVKDYTSHDNGETFDTFVYPKSMDSKRVKICYAEDGGTDKDGLIEIRRNVDDLSLGNSHYAQVRILVDNDKYMKGMAIYSDNIPDGADIVFNTNKSRSTPKGEVFKPIENDPSNPFGSNIKVNGQSYYDDKNGKRQLSLINKRAEEGDWNEWSDRLPSQFLAKQKKELIEKQLNLSIADKHNEFDEICSLPNPTLRKIFLKSFSDDCDAAASHLDAAALPRQKYHVLLPVTSMKDTEVYAPKYKNGEQVALVRYPHGGTFEIPILTVNNKHKDAKDILGNTPADAIGINKKVADRLSGADFDGDAVMVIPVNSKVRITSTPPLKGLEGFDTKMAYPPKKDKDGNIISRVMSKSLEQKKMGEVSNLITDMTLKGAKNEEIAKAVRHSMVVIDSVKHKLDYRQSYIDNDIATLEKRYKGRTDESGKFRKSASTLISRANTEMDVVKRQGSPRVNKIGKPWYDPNKPEGAQIWFDTKEPTYIDRKGKVKTKTQKSTQMYETDDAFTLSSGTSQEKYYAQYANKLKALANQARKEMVYTGNIIYSRSAKAVYRQEYDSLLGKLNTSLKNAPRERKAKLIANSVVNAKIQSDPDLKNNKKELGKIRQRELKKARTSVGAERTLVKITDREWEAIQAGAITESRLFQILNHTDIDELRARATPRSATQLSTAKINKIASMKNSGYSIAEIANSIGISPTTVSNYLKGKGGE